MIAKKLIHKNAVQWRSDAVRAVFVIQRFITCSELVEFSSVENDRTS